LDLKKTLPGNISVLKDSGIGRWIAFEIRRRHICIHYHCQEISYIIYHTVDTLGCFLTKEISLKLWKEGGKEKIGKKERKIRTSKEKKKGLSKK